MKNILGILKGSPIVVGSLIVVVACLAFLFLVIQSGSASLRDEVTKRTAVENQIRSLENTQVIVPGEKPDDPYRTVTTTINEVTLKELGSIHSEMNGQFTKIFEKVANYNENGSEAIPNPHKPMWDNLFPDGSNDDVLYEGKAAYLRQLTAMLGAATANETMPRINAGVRHTIEYEQEQLQKVEDRFLATRLVERIDSLPKADQQTLWKKKRTRLEQIINGIASKIDLYAETKLGGENYPLQVGEWALIGDRPKIQDLWEGQMGLWIQQDILRAIQRANDVPTEMNKLNTLHNVTTNPVKRLISLRVAPGYVGINSAGAMGTLDSLEGLRGRDRQSGASSRSFEDQYANASREAFNRSPVATKASDKLVEDFAQQSPDKRLPSDFKTSATGRISNSIYDVRHARLVVVVDARQIPVFMKELARVNFMTVLNLRITDVDEYEALREGYLYGNSDAVELDILIETIWLRDWTVAFMPKEIRQTLAIKDKTDDAGASAGKTN